MLTIYKLIGFQLFAANYILNLKPHRPNENIFANNVKPGHYYINRWTRRKTR